MLLDVRALLKEVMKNNISVEIRILNAEFDLTSPRDAVDFDEMGSSNEGETKGLVVVSFTTQEPPLS